jgi:hypothetical protein
MAQDDRGGCAIVAGRSHLITSSLCFFFSRLSGVVCLLSSASLPIPNTVFSTKSCVESLRAEQRESRINLAGEMRRPKWISFDALSDVFSMTSRQKEYNTPLLPFSFHPLHPCISYILPKTRLYSILNKPTKMSMAFVGSEAIPAAWRMLRHALRCDCGECLRMVPKFPKWACPSTIGAACKKNS